MSPRHASATIASLVLASSFSSSSCGTRDGGAGASTLYVARADDTEGDHVSIALLADQAQLTAYVCPDDPEREPYAGWFHGAFTADAPAVVTSDGFRLVAERTAGGVTVTLTSPAGKTTRFAGAPASASGLTGLYAAELGGCTTGAIVIDDGNHQTVHGASCDDAGQGLQVTPAQPIALVDGKLPVDVRAASALRRMLLAPVLRAGPVP
jgi:hypothetical protein